MSSETPPDRGADRLSAQAELAEHYRKKALAAAQPGGEWRALSRDAFDELTVAYKALVDDRRADWRRLGGKRRSGDGDYDDDDDDDYDDDCFDDNDVEVSRCLAWETVDLCRDFCSIVDRQLQAEFIAPADRAHALKLKADFYRYANCPRDAYKDEGSDVFKISFWEGGYVFIENSPTPVELTAILFL